MAGLIVYADDDNYFEVARGYVSGNYFRVLKETGGVGVSQNVPDTVGGSVYLKMVKSGNNYSGYYSSDGISWTQIGTTYTGVTLINPRVGLFAQHSGTAASINADFDYFSMQRPGATDQFNLGTLDTGLWSWVREDSTNWSLTANPSQMRITTQYGDLWFGNNSTKNILLQLPASTDYAITTKLTFSPSANYQMAGLIVYADDDNYFEVARSYASGNYFRVLKETGGMGTYQNVPDTLGGTVYLKMVKSGTSYSGYYSSDGISWTQIGTTYTGITLTNPRVGLFAQHSGTAASINADFDYFSY
jgi:beta-xylosidase